MNRFWVRASFALVIFLATTCAVLACKYSVRDVGFVDLGSSSYRLIVWYGEETSAEDLKQMKAAVIGKLTDTNVRAEWIDVRDGETPVLDRFRAKFNGGDSTAPPLPYVGLVSPEDTLHEVTWDRSATDGEAFRKAIGSVVNSPTREKILSELLSIHSILLVVEGSEEAHRAQAATLAAQAVKRVTQSLPYLPKAIDKPPLIITLTPEEAKREAVLCWSLGLEPSSTETQIVVLFGRGRIMGIPLKVPGITRSDILLWEGYVGQDCECGLDRAVMQGIMFPHVWDSEREAEAVKHLDFDPGSPLVQSEISRIVARSSATGRQNLQIGLTAEDRFLSSYAEIEIETPLPAEDQGSDPGESEIAPEDKSSVENGKLKEASANDLPASSSTASSPANSADDIAGTDSEADSASPLITVGASLAALVVAALALGGWFLLRSTRGA